MVPIFVFSNNFNAEPKIYEPSKKELKRANNIKKRIVKFLNKNKNRDVTASDIAAALNLEKYQINGSIVALEKDGLIFRINGEQKTEKGTYAVKYIKIKEK